MIWSKVAAVGMMMAGGLLAAPTTLLACHLNVGDRVWNDANRNGVQDIGESGINGVRVTISPGFYSNRLDPNSFVTSVVTQTGPGEFGDGYYMFYPVDCDVTYTIAVDISTVPAGMQATVVRAGGDPAVDSDDPAGTEVRLPLTGFDYGNVTIDFGFYIPTPATGTGTPGYWKNHPEAWPVASVIIGNVTYSKEQALVLFDLPDGDKTVTMFRHLASAKLNLLNGTDGSCITEDVAAGDQWMFSYGPVGQGVRASSAAWRMGSPIASELDAYNNGLLCAPHRQ